MSEDEKERVGILTERIDNLIERLDRFEANSDSRFVTKNEFLPVQKIVYGGVGLVLSFMFSAVIGFVFIKIK
jgi:hypothetical protein